MIKINEIYSHSNKNKTLEEETKLNTKNKTEYIEFCTVIIANALKIKMLEKTNNKKLSK